jgi:HD superfamily phosphohydrolase YqeK
MAGDPGGLPPWATVGRKRLAHVERVVALVAEWADALAVEPGERARWLRAAWLHDAMRDAPADELRRWAPDPEAPAELVHGPAAAARAEAEGERDAGVLSAVRHHSVGSAEWDMAGRVLYCADFLEPGRSFDRRGRAALAARLPADPAGVLYEVARRRLAFAIDSGFTLPEQTVRFWNSLAHTAGPA